MDTEPEEFSSRYADEWRRILKAGRLPSVRPEDIFAACRDLDIDTEGRLKGELMAALAELAARFLRRRVSSNYPNEGKDIIHAALGKLQDAILVPGHADVIGYSKGFFAKLDLRLMDQIRRLSKQSKRDGTAGTDEDGEEIDFPDIAGLSPEKALELDELLHDMDSRKRQALALIAIGYRAYSDNPEESSVSSMLKISRKTAESWIREMKKIVLERI